MAEATTEAQFQQAAEDAKKLTKKPNNSDLLILYGLYKQATEGDCNTKKPGMMDMTALAKWNAWNKEKGKTKEQAQLAYIDVVKKFKEKYGFSS